MRCIWKWLPSLGGSLLIAANTFAHSPVAAHGGANPVASTTIPADDERHLRPLLDRLGELSRLIDRNAQSPQLWQYHLEQAEVLLRLAANSKEKEREGILHMAVDGFYSAALLSPREQVLAWQRLQELPRRLARYFPGSPIILYAILQEIQADCTRVMEKTGGDRVKAEEYHCARLLQFAREHPEIPEAARAVLQAAQISESLGEAEEACRCYDYLVEHFPNDALARKAEGAMWRLGQNQQPMSLELPLLYKSSSSSNTTFNLDEMRGRLVVVYFWTSASKRAAEDFRILKQLTDRYGSRGLDVVYVNMDAEAAEARAFLSGRLTAGVHVHQAGGLDGPLAERYGLQEVPQAFLISRDGTLMKHSLPASRLETELAGNLPRRR